MHSSINQCSKYELDITRTPPIQTSIESSLWDNIEPNSSWNTNSVITFNISGSNDKYVDLSQIKLYIKLEIKKSDLSIGDKKISSLLKELSKASKDSQPTQYKGVNDKILAKSAPKEKAAASAKSETSKSVLTGQKGNPDPRKGK